MIGLKQPLSFYSVYVTVDSVGEFRRASLVANYGMITDVGKISDCMFRGVYTSRIVSASAAIWTWPLLFIRTDDGSFTMAT